MKYRPLGCSSLQASVLGIGALHFGVYVDQEMTTRLIRRGLDLGINFIDTAPLYGQGNSETFVGNAIRGRRHDFLITTKVGLNPKIGPDGSFGVSVASLKADVIRTSLDKSLRALGTDYVDLFQVHAFDPSTPVEETLETLDDLVQEGKVRHIGCSNYDEAEFSLASDAAEKHGWRRFVAFQVYYNLLERRAEQHIVPACQAARVGIICNRALACGILTGKYKRDEPLPQDSRGIMSTRVRRRLSEEVLGLVAVLDGFARECGHSSAELAVAWLLARPGVSVVLAGMREMDQLATNVRATEWTLSGNDLEEIDEIIGVQNMTSQVQAMPSVFFET